MKDAFLQRFEWFYFNFILGGAIFVTLNSCQPPSPQPLPPDFPASKRCENLKADSTREEMVVIENRSAFPSTFQVSLNKRLFLDMEEILEEIRMLPDEMPAEPLARKAWRYVVYNSHDGTSFNEGRELHHPAVFLNSAGVGFCDDRASALAQIWRKQGYRARVWSLQGHVVPEVLLDGRWSMFDPDFGMYYLNDKGQVAGVEGLQEHPEWMRNPEQTYIAKQFWYSFMVANTEFISEASESKADNEVNPWYDSIPEPGPMEFTLPPGGQIRIMPAGPEDLQAPFPMVDRADIEIDFPVGSAPTTENARLIVASIQGAGQLNLLGRSHSVEDLQAAALQGDLLLDELEIAEVENTITVQCRLNPFLAQIKSKNELCLTGKNLDSLRVEIQELPENKSAERYAKRAADRRFLNIISKYAPLATQLKPINTMEDVDANLNTLLSHHKDEMAWVKRRMRGYLELPDPEKRLEVMRILRNPDAFVLLFGLVYEQ